MRNDALPERIRDIQLIGSAQLAAVLNLSPVHIRRLARSGDLPKPIKVGRRKLAWRVSDVTHLIQRQQIQLPNRQK